MVIDCMRGHKTRTVRCTECKEEFSQSGFGEDGCFSQTFWTPNECPNCGAFKKFEVPYMFPIFPSDLEKT